MEIKFYVLGIVSTLIFDTIFTNLSSSNLKFMGTSTYYEVLATAFYYNYY